LPASLVENSYGKSRVRLTKIIRRTDRHELFEVSIDIRLEGDFANSYLDGDNRKVIATDSMKNTVYVLAAEKQFESIEEFAILLARHFKTTYSQVRSATVEISRDRWERIAVDGQPHPHAFAGAGSEQQICKFDGETLHGGIRGLQVVKTTASEFSDFVTDRYRTLRDAKDRIFGTVVNGDWEYASEKADFNAAAESIRRALLVAFAKHHSLAVQQTLLVMGEAALSACPNIKTISLEMPNKHRIPFDLKPFGLENRNEVFVTTDEPYGLIRGTVARK
jgi:urate oxidase